MEASINSLVNPKIKNILKLKKASERKKQKLFVVEGEREISIGLASGLQAESLFVCEKYNKNKEKIKIEKKYLVSEDVFKKISLRESPDGNIALFFVKGNSLSEVKKKKNPLYLILESIEKPGNFGAIMRTADAAGVDGVIINNPQLDIYNPNAIRASQGTIFSVPIYVAGINETVDFCKKHGIKIFATTPRTTNEYIEESYIEGSAILLGAEDRGLSEQWLGLVENKIKIKMLGKIDSLNLSVSAAVVIFEALRQRKFLSPID